MSDPISPTGSYEIARKLLDASALRQEAIASNIANSETPGYRRIDVSPSFADQLRSELRSGDTASLDSVVPTLAEDTQARSVRPDGNSVDIEHELLAMNKNAVEYDYLSQVVTTNIKQLKVAISGSVG